MASSRGSSPKRRRGGRLPVYLTTTERDTVIATARARPGRGRLSGPRRDVAVLAIGFFAGLRVSEIRGLDRADVDLEALTLRVRHGKGDKDRELDLHPLAAKAIADYLSRRRDSNPALIMSRKGGRISVSALQRLVKKLAGEARITKHVTPHKLRHTFATLLRQQGVRIEIVQELLGHESMDTTRIYSHVADPEKREAVMDQ